MMNVIGRTLRLAVLLLMAVVAARAEAAATLQVLSGSGWRSSDVLVAGWESPGFDDSGWAYARGAYPNPGSPQDLIPGTLATPMWHDPAATSNGMSGPNSAFFRYAFELPSLPVNGLITMSVDDDYRLYVNGSLAFENQDGGNAQIVDHIDVSALLREGSNTLAIMAVDGALAGPYDRLYERVLLDGRISTVDTRLSLNGTPILPEMLPSLGLGDALEAQGALHVPLQVAAGAVVSGTDHLLVTGKVGIANGSIGMPAGKTLQLKERGSIEGYGAVMGKLVGGVASAIRVSGGDLKLGALGQALAVEHDGDIHVAAGRTLEFQTKEKVALGGKTTLAGGSVKVADEKFVELKKGAAIEGFGVVGGKVAGAAGSAIKVSGGDLKLGALGQALAVEHDGDIHVEAGRTLELQMKEKVALGGRTTLAGGSVKVADEKVVELKKGAGIEGFGVVGGKVAGAADSAIKVSGGDLKLGALGQALAVEHDGAIHVEAGRTLELQTKEKAVLGGRTTLAGGSVKVVDEKVVELKKGAAIEGFGVVGGKVAGAAGSAIKVSGGDLKLGALGQALAVEHDGDIHVAAGRTLEFQTNEKVALGGKTTLAGGSVKVADEKVVELKKGAAIEGFGVVGGKVAGGAGSAIKVSGGDLKLGALGQALAVVHDGAIHVEAGRTLTAESLDAIVLGGDVNLAGGRLAAKNGIGIGKEGRLAGSGVVQGAVKSEGVISPGASFGVLQFEDGLALGQDSVLEMELGLLGGALGYDQLRVGGPLSLGGLLRIILSDDYLPSAGDFADFLVADSLALAFSSLELIAPGRQLAWTAGVVDLPDARQAWRFEILSAQAVDEPPVPVLLGAALLACVGCRRRRGMAGLGAAATAWR